MTRIVCLLSALVALVFCAAAARAEAPPVDARWSFKKGDVLRYRVTDAAVTDMKSGGNAFHVASTATFDVTATVTAVDAAGRATLSIQVDRARFDADSPMSGKVAVDTKDAAPAAPAPGARPQPGRAIRGVFDAVVKEPLTVTVDALGAVGDDAKWPAPAAEALGANTAAELAGFFGDVFTARGMGHRLTAFCVPLPGKPVGPGVEWSADGEAALGKVTTTYRCGPAAGGKAGATLAGKLTTVTRDPSKGDKGERGSAEGAFAFDAAAGRLVSLDLPTVFVVPPDQGVTGSSSSRITVVAAEPADGKK